MSKSKGGVVRHAREALSMTRKTFGIYLAKIIGRDKPFAPQIIYAWEKGIKTPRPKVREACSSISASACVSKIEKVIKKNLTKKEKEIIIHLIIEHQS